MSYLTLSVSVLTSLGIVGSCTGGASDPDAGSPDASLVDATVADATTPRCDPNKPFGAPTLLAGLNTLDDEHGARLTADEKTIFFARWTDEGDWIYTAERDSPDDPFGPASLAPGINDVGARHAAPAPTPDGLTLYFSRNTDFTDIYVAVRASRDRPFEAAREVTSIGTLDYESDAYPTATGLYFTRGRTADNGWYHSAIAYARRLAGGELDGGAFVESVNAPPANEGSPVVSADERHILWFSMRPTSTGRTDGEIWEATRPSLDVPFGPAVHLADLGSTAEDHPSWLSPDGCALYLASARPEPGLGGRNLYVARRPL